MQSRIPLLTLLRFPVIFGSFLIAGATAFVYREKFLEDAEAKREILLQENKEDRREIEQKMMKNM